jgi:hypothetical protein
MNLDELAALGVASASPGVPPWTLGCFRRRSITFFNGATDSSTQVYWLQSPGLTADLRLYPGLPSRSLPPEDLSPEELAALARNEGGLARTTWDGTTMAWSDWTSFQIHDRWPEAGILRRVGDCLIEHAPSGAYVEDWRLQPSPPGPLIALRLEEERDLATRAVLHRGGGLIVCGRHAALVRGRPAPLPRPPADVVRTRDPALIRAVFSCEASYAQRASDDGPFTVVASTHPRREGHPLLPLDGFEATGAGQVVQRIAGVERHFTIDCLAANHPFPTATAATAEAQAWLARETDILRGRASDSR